jgi:hypothetical protein
MIRWGMRMFLLTALALLAASCSDGALTGEGQPCVTSGECAQGLLCDFGRTPHLCEPSDTVGRDMTVHIPDAAVPDLSGSSHD